MATRAGAPDAPINGDRVPTPATTELLARYSRFLTGQRGLSANTHRIYLDDLHKFLAYCRQEGRSLQDMDRQLLRGYVAHLATCGRSDGPKPEGYARVSIVRMLTAVRTFYNFLVQEGWFTASPVPSARSFPIKVQKPLPSFLGEQETSRLLDAPDTSTPLGVRDRALLEVLYACGVRLAEVHGMNVGDVIRARREILVTGKGNKQRYTLYGEPAADALERYIDEARPQLTADSTEQKALFVNRYGGRLSRRSIEKLVSGYSARVGLRAGTHTHTLRHSFASHMLAGDADLRVIQELLGHSSVSTTQMYTHITKQESRRAYLKFHPLARESEIGGDPPDTAAPLVPDPDPDQSSS